MVWSVRGVFRRSGRQAPRWWGRFGDGLSGGDAWAAVDLMPWRAAAPACPPGGAQPRSAPDAAPRCRSAFETNSAVSLSQGNGAEGGSTPRNAHSGPHPWSTS